jgi:hypothetical protein
VNVNALGGAEAGADRGEDLLGAGPWLMTFAVVLSTCGMPSGLKSSTMPFPTMSTPADGVNPGTCPKRPASLKFTVEPSVAPPGYV